MRDRPNRKTPLTLSMGEQGCGLACCCRYLCRVPSRGMGRQRDGDAAHALPAVLREPECADQARFPFETVMLWVLAGHRRYAHIEVALRG
jgi:hypothetical protein